MLTIEFSLSAFNNVGIDYRSILSPIENDGFDLFQNRRVAHAIRFSVITDSPSKQRLMLQKNFPLIIMKLSSPFNNLNCVTLLFSACSFFSMQQKI